MMYFIEKVHLKYIHYFKNWVSGEEPSCRDHLRFAPTKAARYLPERFAEDQALQRPLAELTGLGVAKASRAHSSGRRDLPHSSAAPPCDAAA